MMEKMENNKLAFHLLADNEQFEEFFTEAKEQGIERGLHFRTEVNLHKDFLYYLEKAKKQGYFPVGLILDGQNLEMLFKRHPKQEIKHRFVELKDANENMKM